ncbi:MAG TPA: SRPBCC family protein, partial [Micromonosporaceae bacterium]|nr:SRPBCC family protein [Micromonosporaceae bacterium]
AFTVPVPLAQAWAVLLDVERVAPCVPGATLTVFDEDSFSGDVRLKVGPISLTYQGKGRFVERDEEHRRVVMEATGRDRRGNGTAAGKVTATLRTADEDPGSTLVAMVADLAVTGRPAQMGRGMITEVGGKLIGQFADCLAARLAESAPSTVDAKPSTVEPVPSTVETEPATAEPARAEPARAEPVDLLAVTGVTPALRRAMPYVIGFVAGALVMWALLAAFG